MDDLTPEKQKELAEIFTLSAKELKLPAAELFGQCAQESSPSLSGTSKQARANRRPRKPAIFISLEAPFTIRTAWGCYSQCRQCG
jgi:hypothetical protein